MLSYHPYRAGCVLRASGPDAAEFLQGQFSNDLSGMSDGDIVYGLWLNRKGKIVADSFVLRRGDEDYLLISYYCSEQVVFERLDAYLIMEEVELEKLSDVAKGASFFGELGESGDLMPAKGKFVERDGVVVFWGRRSKEPCLEVVTVAQGGGVSFEKVCSELLVDKVVTLSDEDMAEVAICSQVPRIGIRFGESDLPQELGLEADAVSFAKGCYLGQEVMARLHAMGRVRKRMSLFRIGEVGTMELPVDLLDSNGKRQGSLREVAYPKSGCVGLGVVNVSCEGEELWAGGVAVSPVDRQEAGDD